MRITHLSQPTDGGTAVVVRELARRGVLEGDDVTVCCPRAGQLATWAVEVGAHWIDIEMCRAPKLRDLGQILEVRRIAHAADVIHLHSSKAGAIGRIAARTMRNPPRIFFTPHAWSWYSGGERAWIYRRFEKWAARLSEMIICVSQQEFDDGRRLLGRDANLEIIHNGVDGDAFSPDGPRADRFGRSVVLCVGRLCRQKGQDRLLAAVASLPTPDLTVRFVGDGEDRESLARLSERLGLSDRVEFVGEGDPRPYLRSADVVVFASRWEGMSVALLEAMAIGCPIITTDVGGAGALGDGGWTVAGTTEDEIVHNLAGAITEALADSMEARGRGHRAHDRAHSQFSLKVMTDHYVELWQPLETSVVTRPTGHSARHRAGAVSS